jgi:hypothetical protein
MDSLMPVMGGPLRKGVSVGIGCGSFDRRGTPTGAGSFSFTPAADDQDRQHHPNEQRD